MRDWKKLNVFQTADKIVLEIYRLAWPTEHRYGLPQQIQRAAVSVASNIVEGCSRHSEREYLRFIEIAYGSACELQYQLSVARRLEWPLENIESIERDVQVLCKGLNVLTRSLKPEA